MRTFLLACLLLLPPALVGPAGAVAAQPLNHLFQTPVDHVVLRALATDLRDDDPCSGDFEGKAFFRVHPDGTQDALRFAVPSGRLLMVTDVEWTSGRRVSGAPLLAGRPTVLSLALKSPGSFQQPVVFRSEGVRAGYGQSRVVAGSDQLTAGFAVAAQTKICPSVAQLTSSGANFARLRTLVLRGYLVDVPQP